MRNRIRSCPIVSLSPRHILLHNFLWCSQHLHRPVWFSEAVLHGELVTRHALHAMASGRERDTEEKQTNHPKRKFKPKLFQTTPCYKVHIHRPKCGGIMKFEG